MSILQTLFGGASNNQPSAAANTNANPGAGNPGNIPNNAAPTGAQPNGSTAPNGTIPGNTSAANQDPNAQKTNSPLDAFSELWKIDPAKEGQNQDPSILNVDPKKLFEAAGKVDFTRSINPESMKAIAAGGDEAVKAFLQSMNSVAQGVYGQSALSTTKIVEQALAQQQERFMTELPNIIKKHQVSDSLRAENPVFSNPAVQPIMSALESQLTVKFPQATASEITKMAKQYVEALGTSFAPKPTEPDANKTAGKGETDWSTFLQQ